MNRNLVSVLLAFSLLLPASPLLASEAPPLMLAKVFHTDLPLADYLVSEKFDGVRGYWDGKQLLTRSGEVIHAPAWFTANWPNTPLDGELWAGYNNFAQAVSTVRQTQADDTAWHQMSYLLFDLPAHPGSFAERDAALTGIVTAIQQPWVRHVTQFKVADLSALRALLTRLVRQGSEGLVLHRSASPYRAERNDDLLKFKLYEDAEARVIGHLAGMGKYEGMLGALEVETRQGLRFKLGSGLSDNERRDPPPVGSWVTYRYNGVNKKTGIPRFARFLRLREDLDAP